MSENKNTFWNLAGRTGLVLGGISIAFYLLDSLLKLGANASTFLALLISLVSIALVVVKLVAVIKALKSAMEKYKSTLELPTSGQLFRFGMACSLLSSLVVAGFILLYLTYIAPDTISASLDAAREMLATGGMAGVSSAEIEESFSAIEGNFPSMMFWGYLVYCLIWGLILSSIVGSRVANANPFDNQEENEEDDD